MQREAEDLSAKLWNIVKAASTSAALPQLKAKREQLKVVSESIEELSSKDVPVPDDLPRLKETLTDEIEKADRDQVVLYFLKEQLSQMLAAIENNIDVKALRAKEQEPQ
jgi:predicted transcriptional regulator